ncbi:hypothetical protein C9439_04135 [archaeon SCG-AAA382B04]|nr:hypothetical protein C9439_04135 [archaeon SCG-AAA382B04]
MLSDEQIKTIRTKLKEYEEIKAVYLYGSFAKDREDEISDIDLGLLLGKEDDLGLRDLAKIALDLEQELDREVDLRRLNNNDIRFVNNVLNNSKLLFSRDEGFRKDFEAKTLIKYLDMKPMIEKFDERNRREIKNE